MEPALGPVGFGSRRIVRFGAVIVKRPGPFNQPNPYPIQAGKSRSSPATVTLLLFFFSSKVVWFFLQPSTIAALAIAAGLVLSARSRRFGRLGFAVATVGTVLLLLGGYSPISNILLLPLEERFPVRSAAELEKPVDGIIILGGFEDFNAGTDQPGLPINEASERLTEGVRLARLNPTARIVFTGARIWGLDTSTSFAGQIGDFLVDMGIARDRIVLEGRARNTYENATKTKALVAPKPNERWVLVTSGFHMPRSVGVFRKVGFDVIPFPVDLRIRGAEDALAGFTGLSSGLLRLDLVVREYVGLLAYWLTGRTDALFPGPVAP